MSGNQTNNRLPSTFFVPSATGNRPIDIYTEEGYAVLTELWLRSGWERQIYSMITWLGVPIGQLPEDLLMMQECIQNVRPDVIVETGTYLGGTALFYASMLELIGGGHVISVDAHAYERPQPSVQSLNRCITFITGNSTDPAVVAQVSARIKPTDRVLVALDSDHSRAHVQKELEVYAPLVTPGSYIVVFDGVMEVLADAPRGSSTWAGDSPAPAIRDFLAAHPEFLVDPRYSRLQATYSPNGYLRRRD